MSNIAALLARFSSKRASLTAQFLIAQEVKSCNLIYRHYVFFSPSKLRSTNTLQTCFGSHSTYKHNYTPIAVYSSIPPKEEKHENIYTIPNFLTVGRFLSAPALGYLVCQEKFGLACSIFMLAGVTDLLDGYIARRWKGQASVLGTVIDPLADKFLVTILSLTLTAVGLIPVWLTSLIVARDVYLVINGFRVRYLTLPPPKTFKRYFDFSLPSAKVQPTLISKINTNFQLVLIAATMGAPVFDYIDHPFLHLMWGVTAFTTTWSFISYLRINPYTVLKH